MNVKAGEVGVLINYAFGLTRVSLRDYVLAWTKTLSFLSLTVLWFGESDRVTAQGADTTPPTISSVGTLGDNTIVTVLYSEPVEAASGTNRLNYALNNGAAVN